MVWTLSGQIISYYSCHNFVNIAHPCQIYLALGGVWLATTSGCSAIEGVDIRRLLWEMLGLTSGAIDVETELLAVL